MAEGRLDHVLYVDYSGFILVPPPDLIRIVQKDYDKLKAKPSPVNRGPRVVRTHLDLNILPCCYQVLDIYESVSSDDIDLVHIPDSIVVANVYYTIWEFLSEIW